MLDPVTALARKWCYRHGNAVQQGRIDTTHPLAGALVSAYTPDQACTCAQIAAAVREALEGAEKVCDGHMGHGDQACLAAVMRDIAALRGGTGS